MKEKTEYEIQKEKNKQKLVRNEFLYHGNSAGKFEFPIVKKQNIDIEKIKLLSYVDTKVNDENNKDKTIHFFTYDWKFEKVYENAEQELEKLSQYYCLFSPDFSMFTNMPLALQIANVFKNRWCAAYWQSKGLKVIPTVSWGDARTFNFCFDGIEEGAAVVVCTYYRENDEESFMLGYNEMIKRIKPSLILCYDEPFAQMQGNVKSFLPTTYEWIKDLSPQEQARFYFEKRHRNVMGLDPSSFKYFKYEDPYAEIYLTKCPVCGAICYEDQFGNGECKNCTWKLTELSKKFPDSVSYPNMVSYNKAKILYAQNKPLKPSFDDFVAALKRYSEMTFYYKNVEAAVYLNNGGRVYMEYGGDCFEFANIKDFRDTAQLDGKPLDDIWDKVKNADYMQG